MHMHINMELEESKLREALGQEAHFPPDIVAQRKQMLEWLDEVAEDETYPLFCATLDYCATGEGHLHWLIASREQNHRDFILHLLEELGGHYYVIGVDIFKGVLPENETARVLLSPALKKELKAVIKGEDCHYTLNLHRHVNYS